MCGFYYSKGVIHLNPLKLGEKRGNYAGLYENPRMISAANVPDGGISIRFDTEINEKRKIQETIQFPSVRLETTPFIEA